ncbi:hypothetical protein Pla123a_28570 [Posidoniimonas polymericola]|uniref:PEP-CTERM protein-sorting domain-containing protein n=1 Tax=Posidoniimonas polymericola TaxID=2528002 RepID=A0A5C5YML4_9BACT|nr:hypothetical protein [Posidoniimonas polymericola]TWT76070.1 hypothetical protein Pla123a_28570 [Posidoniimonas polymericola]
MNSLRSIAGVAVAAAALVCPTQTRAELTGVYDLTWNGAETSTATEFPAGIYFETYPIRGGLQLDLDPVTPRLINVQSDIMLHPGGTPNSPAAISPEVWGNFDLLTGVYAAPANEGDISLVFTPTVPDGLIRGGWELLVDITNGGQSLSLTGGIQQEATSPMEPDVVFAVSGQLIEGDFTGFRVPEPAAGMLLLSCSAWLGVIASRRRQ